MGAAESSDAFPAPGAPSSTTRVTGRIVGRAKAQPGAAVRIVNVETAESRNARIYMDGSFEFAGVQPGQYLAEVFPNLPGAVPATLEVGTRDLRDFQLKVPSTRDIEGKVAVEGAGAAPRSLVFVVASSRVAAPVLPDGSFTVTLPDGLPVALAPDALPNGYEVSAVRYGTLDLLQNPLPAARAGELRVTLKSTGAAAVSGRVSGDPPSPDAVRIWLTDSAGRQRALETTLRPDRTFAFPGVVPGRYNVSLVAAGAYVSKTIDVAAGRDVTDVELTAPRLVRGRIEGGTPLQRFGLQLAGQETEPGVVFIDPQRDGSFNVLLPAGERTIGAATGLPMGLEIDTINYGTTDLRKSPLRVPAAGAVDELKIQLRPIAR
jgi:hypothetical protein